MGMRCPRAWSRKPCSRETDGEGPASPHYEGSGESRRVAVRGPWGNSHGRAARQRAPPAETPRWSAERRDRPIARPVRLLHRSRDHDSSADRRSAPSILREQIERKSDTRAEKSAARTKKRARKGLGCLTIRI